MLRTLIQRRVLGRELSMSSIERPVERGGEGGARYGKQPHHPGPKSGALPGRICARGFDVFPSFSSHLGDYSDGTSTVIGRFAGRVSALESSASHGFR